MTVSSLLQPPLVCWTIIFVIKMADIDHKGKDTSSGGKESSLIKHENRDNNSTNGGKGSGDDADSLEEQPLDIGEHYLVRRSDDSWRE